MIIVRKLLMKFINYNRMDSKFRIKFKLKAIKVAKHHNKINQVSTLIY